MRLALATLLAFVLVAAVAIGYPPLTITDKTQNTITLGGLNCGKKYKIKVTERRGGKWEDARTKKRTTEPCPTEPPPPSCSTTATSAAQARSLVEAAPAGSTVCLAEGSYEQINLLNIDKPATNPVTFRGVGTRATTINGMLWAGSTGLVIENFRSTQEVSGAHQYVADHITFRYNDFSSTGGGDCLHSIGSWGTAGQKHIVVERNFFHDCNQYGIRAQGDASDWIIRNNRFERVREDYLQAGNPSNWVVDHNTFGPGDFNRPAGYPGHPDIFQSLDSASNIDFTNNLLKDTNQSLGFIFGAIGDYPGYGDIRVVNNVFARTVYGVGETCQFPPTNGFVFEQNTMVNTQGCRWGAAEGQPWEINASNFSIKRNILSGNASLSCNNTTQTNVCGAFNAGFADNVSGFTNWAETTYYTPNGVAANVGARLSSADFQGYPFQ